MSPVPDGKTVIRAGWIIPPLYKLYDDPEYAFICPVRDCRKVLSGYHGLNAHFCAVHWHATYNDNRDGTISKVRSYNNPDGQSLPIVVSDVPIGPNAPPPAHPQINSSAANRGGKLRPIINDSPWFDPFSGSGSNPSTPNANVTPIPLPVQPQGASAPHPSTEVTRYLHEFLSPEQVVPETEDVQELVHFKKQRDLPPGWVQYHTGRLIDAKLYACAAAYAVGEEVTGAPACKRDDRRTRRLTSRMSERCIKLPQGLSTTARAMFSQTETCIGCKYQAIVKKSKKTECDWSDEAFVHQPGDFAYVPPGSKPPTMSTPIALTPSSGAMDVDPVSRPMSTLEQAQNPVEPYGPPPVAGSSGIGDRIKKRRATEEAGRDTEYTEESGKRAMPDDEEPMEDWEMAPGRLQNNARKESKSTLFLSNPSHHFKLAHSSTDVAFSKAYLKSTHPVTLAEDFAVNILTVPCGGKLQLAEEHDKLRSYHVGRGKIRVKTGDETFSVGSGGVLMLRPGQSCSVENRTYVDAEVYCTTIGNYELRRDNF